MTIRIAINGFGRIGRSVVRALYESRRHTKITIIAINEPSDTFSMSHLLKYDTNHGRFAWDVYQEKEKLFIGKDLIHILHEETLRALPWNELDIDIVLDCTGIYGSRKDGEEHLLSGARKVLYSYLGEHDLDATVVYGVNHRELCNGHRIVSNASCTTNCVVPVIKLLDDAWDIQSGMATIIHPSMHDQKVTDTYHSDLRLARASSQSIVPIETRLISGISRIFPKFGNRFEATAVRVPTTNVTAIVLSMIVKNKVKTFEVNTLIQKASQREFRGIIDYKELPLVSIDFNHDSHSAIFDGTQTRANGAHFVKMLIWCDNEWGFANRMLDTTIAMSSSEDIQ